MALPKQGDRLFVVAGPWRNTVDVNTTPRWGWFEYIHGYRKAAELLVGDLEQDQSIGAMNLAYPIINLYRHHLELNLKAAIAWGASAAGTNDSAGKHHKLEVLWRTFRQLVQKTHPGHGDEELEAGEQLIAEFSAHDPGGTTFRYPETPHASAPILKRVNLRHFAEVAGRLSDLVDAATSAWSEVISARDELESEARRIEAELDAEAEAALYGDLDIGE